LITEPHGLYELFIFIFVNLNLNAKLILARMTSLLKDRMSVKSYHTCFHLEILSVTSTAICSVNINCTGKNKMDMAK